jgi:hypothetical protein
MFEYINPGFILIGMIFLLFFIGTVVMKKGQDKPEKLSFFDFFPLLFVFISATYLSMDAKSSIRENMKSFNRGHALNCATLSTRYLVSKSNGWKINRDSFTKDSLLIRADRCKN